MFPQWQPAIVRKVEVMGPRTRRFYLRLPETPVFRFRPGQFVTLDLPIHEDRNHRWRSYSIASAPDGGNSIELLIGLRNGAGTKYLFEQVGAGTGLLLRGPHGLFLPPPAHGEDLFLICTGTGIAPFRSMIAQLATQPDGPATIHLVAGCRERHELMYHDELVRLAARYPNVRYYPTLSGESWSGNCGRVHAVYEALCERRQPAHFMLCGWKAMVTEAHARILAMGYAPGRVHLEIYD